MIKVKFNDDRDFRDVEFSIISDSVVQLIGNIPENLSGFKTYKMNGIELGDFSDYKTIHKKVSGGYQLSCDGSKKPDDADAITFSEMYRKLQEVTEENEKLKAEIAQVKEILAASVRE